jgi:DNA end-binding protein Ku
LPRSQKRTKPRGESELEREIETGDDGEERSGPRGIWSGSISFGLVTVPVELLPAVHRERPALRLLSPDGVPLAREYVCPKDDKPLEAGEIERGFEIAEGKFVTVSDEELERLAPRRSRDIELTRFVDRDSLAPAYFVRSYFLIPGGEQTKAYRLLAETMEASHRAAIAHFVMRGKAYAVAILADKGVLRAETLRFGDEVRSAADLRLSKPEKVDQRRVAELRRAVKRLSEAAIDTEELADEEPAQLLQLARKKQKRGRDLVEVPELAEGAEAPAGGDVIDIMALIKQRLREGSPGPSGRRVARADGGKRSKPRRSPGVRRTRVSPTRRAASRR